MWLLNIENKNVLKNIYKGKEPSLTNLSIHELSILMGEDIRIIIKFDLYEIPEELPLKWNNNANTIQFIFEFIDVDLKKINLSNKNYHNGKMIIETENNKMKRVTYIDNNEKIVFDLKTKWIYLKSIIGYEKERI